MRHLKKLVIICAALSIVLNAFLIWHFFSSPWRRVPVLTSVGEPIVIHTKGGLLEVSKVTNTEQFQTSKEHTIFGIPIGNTVSWIRVPAIYRFHIELDPKWKVQLVDNTFVVIAPAVKPSLPVAIDTANLEKQSAGVWSQFTGTALLDQLERSISADLEKKSLFPSMILLQRDVARKTVREFVEKWLITQEKWKATASYPILVYFEDEPIQELRKTPLFRPLPQ